MSSAFHKNERMQLFIQSRGQYPAVAELADILGMHGLRYTGK